MVSKIWQFLTTDVLKRFAGMMLPIGKMLED